MKTLEELKKEERDLISKLSVIKDNIRELEAKDSDRINHFIGKNVKVQRNSDYILYFHVDSQEGIDTLKVSEFLMIDSRTIGSVDIVYKNNYEIIVYSGYPGDITMEELENCDTLGDEEFENILEVFKKYITWK